VCVALVIQHAMRMRRIILSPVAGLAPLRNISRISSRTIRLKCYLTLVSHKKQLPPTAVYVAIKNSVILRLLISQVLL